MLYKTTTEDKHYHIVYLNAETGNMQVADSGKNKKTIHPHDILIDEESGRPIVLEAEGHTHELANLVLEGKKVEKSDNKIIKEAQQLYKEAKNIEKDFRKNGKESEAFRGNDQWKKEDRTKREGSQRAVLTLNHLDADLDRLSGYQRQNRTDITYFPIEGGDAMVADMLTAVVKSILTKNEYHFSESQIFEDEINVGRGLFHLFKDYNKNVEGDIIIEKFPWAECSFGPHTNFDLSDCEYLVKSKWFSSAKLKQMWPEKANKIGKEFDFEDDDTSINRVRGHQYEADADKAVAISTTDPDFVNIARKEYRLVETWQKEYRRVKVAVHSDDDFYMSLDGLKSKDIEAVKSINGMELVPQEVTKLRVTKVAGGVMLEDALSDLPFDDFSIIPVYAKKMGDNIYGKVEAGKDPQREINVRHSQIADILNRVAGYGWFYDYETFRTKKDEDNFKADSAKAGFMAKVSDVNKRPVREEGAKFPAEISNFAIMERDSLREVLGIDPEALRFHGQASSGVAMQQKRMEMLAGNEYLFDNLSFAKRKVGKLLLPLIQDVYTPERIMRLLEYSNKQQKIEIQGQPFDQVDQNTLYALLKESWEDLLEYDVAVGESAYNATKRLADFVMLKEMASQGVPIPPEHILELMDIPGKDKIIQGVQQSQQEAKDLEQKKFDTEIEKVRLAQEGKRGGGERGGQPPPIELPPEEF
ncbi:hypothetical protein KAR91_05790 [Candidatus Pacearchaeota archaeon]|nr:hypothetical protein [Candidatus Pacearchaeota archaeon]